MSSSKKESLILEGLNLVLKGLHEEFGLILDDNFQGTPERVYKSYREMFQGLINTDEEIAKILSSSFPSDGYSSIIAALEIEVYSMCPHHILPVEYKIHLAYIPSKEKGRVLGVSKLIRVVELLAKRPVLQEKLTKDILVAFRKINPLGIAVVVEGTHSCMKMRGVRSPHSTITTSAMDGCFENEMASREEFFHLIRMQKRW